MTWCRLLPFISVRFVDVTVILTHRHRSYACCLHLIISLPMLLCTFYNYSHSMMQWRSAMAYTHARSRAMRPATLPSGWTSSTTRTAFRMYRWVEHWQLLMILCYSSCVVLLLIIIILFCLGTHFQALDVMMLASSECERVYHLQHGLLKPFLFVDAVCLW